MLDTTQTPDIRTTPLPAEMRLLLDAHPRDGWDQNPAFARSTRDWMAAHQLFRDLAYLLRTGAEHRLDGTWSDEDYAPRLSAYGDRLVRALHGHHRFEDVSFFPELSAADARFDRGLEILEADHLALDAVLDRLTRSGNRALKLMQLDPMQVRGEVGLVRDEAARVEAFLERHLGDEEDLVVPILLEHRLRG
ncbi:hemerythrin domain-containing protein [Maritimibacter sp. DP1N21-5]|uniref:hemerythrin domain-containing protein n=1 Tax=Maritimibacter sp. DP1N21-5 TaxID=2836867 RepID=UPI001C494684|nr:hemerythrin domain-containing protein [Maritimibacter sp. DP1N21-5]MBV7410803.1 hemerythrin domain-containing protein [Maritimibacter sp. DP1N21-5]